MNAFARMLSVFSLTAFCVACGGGGSGAASPPAPSPPPVTNVSPGGIWEGIYDIQFGYSNCTGQSTNLNGTSFIGMATLDNTVVPEVLVIGATGNIDGALVSLFGISERL